MNEWRDVDAVVWYQGGMEGCKDAGVGVRALMRVENEDDVFTACLARYKVLTLPAIINLNMRPSRLTRGLDAICCEDGYLSLRTICVTISPINTTLADAPLTTLDYFTPKCS